MESERAFFDPEYETRIVVRESPRERATGGVSPRLRTWTFEGPAGDLICSIPAHHSISIHDLSEIELEAVYLHALEFGEYPL
jgi:hypothetical protein